MLRIGPITSSLYCKALPTKALPSSHFYPKANRKINLPSQQFEMFSSGSCKKFSLQSNPKGDAVNKLKRLGLYAILGICLFSLFPYFEQADGAESLLLPDQKTLNTMFLSSPSQIEDEKALSRYFELLDRYPKLKREGKLNDHTQGTYEIIYDKEGIEAIKKEVYKRLYDKAIRQGEAPNLAHESATKASRPGVVCEDQFWIWIRDAVISPQAYRHTYNRIVWKCDLERIGGAAALPIIQENGIKKFVLQLAFRHATNSWEFEIPRGGSKANETPAEAAKREILEETGFETDDLILLGSITPDSGLTASVVPIFAGNVTIEKATKQDKTEAIKAKHAFTLDEIMMGLDVGYIKVKINDELTDVPLRDPFLAHALLILQYRGRL